jgi:hypothetical protein
MALQRLLALVVPLRILVILTPFTASAQTRAGAFVIRALP